MRGLLKYTAMVVMMLTVAVVASACGNNGGGGGGASNTPDGAAKAWFEAAFAGDTAAVQAQTCAASQSEIQAAADAFASIGAAGGEVDISGLTYTKTTEEGNNATVTVGGNMSVTVAGQSMDQAMENVTMPLVLEGGAWKVCGM